MTPQELAQQAAQDLRRLADTAHADPATAQQTLAKWRGDRDRIIHLALARIADSELVAGSLAALQLVRTLGGLVRELRSAIRASEREIQREYARRSHATSPPPADTGRPQILLGDRQDREILADVRAALGRWNTPPQLVQLHQRVVRVDAEGVPRPLRSPGLQGILAEAADWFTPLRIGALKHTHVERRIADIVLEEPGEAVPVAVRISRGPFLDASGRLVATAGYHASSRTYLALHPQLQVRVPDVVTPDDVARARTLLREELLGDFPVRSQAGWAHLMAMFLQPAVRDCIDGPTPIFLVTSSERDVGKTKVASLVRLLHAGSTTLTTFPDDEQEIRKTLTSLVLSGDPIVVFDNADRAIASKDLAAMITSRQWVDRRFNTQEMLVADNVSTWIFTGQNPLPTDEIWRRLVAITLDGTGGRAGKRNRTFRHPNLERYLLDHRSELLSAVLILARAWVQAGRPRGSASKGSFEAWAEVMGGILDVAGVRGFLDDADEHASLQAPSWADFIVEIGRQRPGEWLSAGSLLAWARSRGVFDALGLPPPKDARALGSQLARKAPREVDGFRLEDRKNTSINSGEWRVVLTSPEDAGRHPEHRKTPEDTAEVFREPESASNACDGDLTGRPEGSPIQCVGENKERENCGIYSCTHAHIELRGGNPSGLPGHVAKDTVEASEPVTGRPTGRPR